jgi:hypothetical protein
MAIVEAGVVEYDEDLVGVSGTAMYCQRTPA